MSKKESGGFLQGVFAVGLTGVLGVAVAKNAFASDGKASASPEHNVKSDKTSSATKHAGKSAVEHAVTPKNPRQVTVTSRISRATAEKLFGVDLQETVIMGNAASNPTAIEVKGIKHVAYVIGKNSYGWDKHQDSCLAELWTDESNWRGNAYNDATATGIPQALWKLHGPSIEKNFPDYRDNVVEQVQWGEEYIAGRYENPCDANYAWWHNYDPNGNHWY